MPDRDIVVVGASAQQAARLVRSLLLDRERLVELWTASGQHAVQQASPAGEVQ